MTTPMTTDWGSWGPEGRDDPFPIFAAARERCPVLPARLPDGHDAWVVVDHDAARQALNDPRISKDMLAALAADGDVVAEGLPGPAFARHMLAVDPPNHTRLRGLVARAFVPSRVRALEPGIRATAAALLADLEAEGPDAVVDLVAGFARPYPFLVIGQLLGIPAADQPTLHHHFQVLLSPWSGDPPPEAVAASDAIVGYLEDLVDAATAHPGDDLVGVLVTASEEGDRLDRQELLSTLFQLVVAGHDTTTSLIGNGVVALLDHPAELDRLRADPALLPRAVEELLRYTAPVPHATFRMTVEPLELSGVTVPAGEQVLVCLGGANRDPSRFADPDRLDVGRDDGPNLAFGHGIHHCLGAPLARLEARVAFETVLGRHPDLRLAVPRADLAWSHGDGLVLRGLASLPVSLGPTVASGWAPADRPTTRHEPTPHERQEP